MSGHVLVVRLDSIGDVIVCGPAIRAVAATADRVTVLAGPAGAEAARLLPGVDDVVVWECPWILFDPPAVDSAAVAGLIARVRGLDVDEALILTSFHQSALPTALLLRLAAVQRIAAVSEDYPGTLLDVRIPSPGELPEPLRMLQIAEQAGYRIPQTDDARLALRADLPLPPIDLPSRYIVAHPGVTAPSRSYPDVLFAAAVAALAADGWQVVVTGDRCEKALTAEVAGETAIDIGGALSLAELAAVLRDACAVVVGNTGPAHLAAAVNTPVVSLFAPVVSAARWAPYGVPRTILGDQYAPCRNTRARVCGVPGHPCLSLIRPQEIVDAVRSLAVSR